MQDYTKQQSLTAVQENTLLRSVYNFMMMGLAISGVTAWMASNSPFIINLIYGNSFVFFGLIIAELAMVWKMSRSIQSSMSASTASTLFLLFSFVNGLTLASVFMVYTAESITATFFVTAVTFGATSLYGYVTKTDLSSIGNYLFMALIGLIIASVVNIFLQSSAMGWIITYAGILIFVGLTAYDTQKIKVLGQTIGTSDGERFGKIAVMGALSLYLDFVNLFLLLLRVLGRRN
jgi:FtsH-binding integral membrane protein